MTKSEKKNQLVAIIILIINVAAILFVIAKVVDYYNDDGSIKNEILNKQYKDFIEIVSGPLSDYNMKQEVDENFVYFSNDKYRVSYYFDNKKISSIGIDIDLNDNTLSGEETVKEIEEIYGFVTNDLSSIKKYLKDDFYLTDKFSLNKYDKEHLIDLLEYKETCSSWSTNYRYEDDHKYLSVSYALYARYDKEGYSSFYIDIY